MKPPNEGNFGPVKAKAWITDAEFGYDHWRAAEYSCGRGTKFAIIHLFESERARDEFYALTIDAEAKQRLVGGEL